MVVRSHGGKLLTVTKWMWVSIVWMWEGYSNPMFCSEKYLLKEDLWIHNNSTKLLKRQVPLRHNGKMQQTLQLHANCDWCCLCAAHVCSAQMHMQHFMQSNCSRSVNLPSKYFAFFYSLTHTTHWKLLLIFYYTSNMLPPSQGHLQAITV